MQRRSYASSSSSSSAPSRQGAAAYPIKPLVPKTGSTSNLIALGKIDHRRLFPKRLHGDLRLQCSVDLTPRLLRHRPLPLAKERQLIQLNPWSQKPGPLHTS